MHTFYREDYGLMFKRTGEKREREENDIMVNTITICASRVKRVAVIIFKIIIIITI